jgi:hypothetical protein
MRTVLGIISAANVLLLYIFARELYSDRRVALIAATILYLSPFFLIQSATFLPYTTNLMLLLLFGFLLLRGNRTNSTTCLVLSGVALGVAFFHRPYDVLLFAVPLGLILARMHAGDFRQLRRTVTRVTVGFLPFLGLTLGYNALLTGDPFLFPYSLYERLDTFGFGPRRQTPYDVPQLYGLEEALRSLWTNFVELNLWVYGGPVLLALAFLRLAFCSRGWQEALLAFMLIIFPLGYFFWWGTHNISEGWGAIAYLGPLYYFPLLAPLVILGAQGLVRIYCWQPPAAVVLITITIVVNLHLLVSYVAKNYEYTEENRVMYEPFQRERIQNGLVFVPPLYGPYIHHPFAYLSNNPSLDGPVLYAIDRGNQNFLLLDRYPDRPAYEFLYWGSYTEAPNDKFETRLIQLTRIKLTELVQRVRIVNPTALRFVYVYVWNDGNTETYLLDDSSDLGSIYDAQWRITNQAIDFSGAHIRKASSDIDSLSDSQPLAVAVAFSDSPDRSSQRIFEYRFRLRTMPDNSMEIILPAEEWYNLDWPTDEWIRGDIDHVIEVDCCSNVSFANRRFR